MISAGPSSRQEFPSDIAFTPAVKDIQTRKGSRKGYARMERSGGWQTKVTPDLVEFLADLDMFYLGTSNADGQPYIQYRGGSPGFLKVLDNRTLGFADFSGNRQFITLGNLAENPKAFIFLMDYANSRSVKLWGTAMIENDPELLEKLRDPAYPGKVERAIVFTVETWDINCPQHIHQRFSQRQVAPVIEQLQQRVAELEVELTKFRQNAGSMSQPRWTRETETNRQPGPPFKAILGSIACNRGVLLASKPGISFLVRKEVL